MKIAILGYGKMGHAVEAAANAKNIEITRVLDTNDNLQAQNFTPDEVVIDFTTKDAFLHNLPILCEKKVNIVAGTTGWYGDVDKIKTLVQKSGNAFLYASNFSLPTQIFWKVIEQASCMMNKVEGMDVMLRETHHNMKKDAPSGTALTTAQKILAGFTKKNKIVDTKLDRVIEPNELHVSSTRGGFVFGEHEVWFDGPNDSVRIIHTAKSRDGFAAGAVLAAQWLVGKPGFHTIDDLLKDIL